MEKNEKIIRMIEGQLDEHERRELEAELEKDPSLREEKELYEQIIAGIKYQGQQNLRKELDTYLTDYLSNREAKSKQSRIRRLYPLLGAAAVVIIGVVYLTVFRNPIRDREEMDFQIDPPPVHADSAKYKPDSVHMENVPEKDSS